MKPSHDPIEIALKEDIGEGDVTSEFFVPESVQAAARIVAREKAVVAGTQTAAEVFRRVDPSTQVDIIRSDSVEVSPNESVLEIRGFARSILKAERVALNFLQHLCGVATLTRQFVDAAGTDQLKILDTRKTTPGLRALEKKAVVAGGGSNHRFGLDDIRRLFRCQSVDWPCSHPPHRQLALQQPCRSPAACRWPAHRSFQRSSPGSPRQPARRQRPGNPRWPGSV